MKRKLTLSVDGSLTHRAKTLARRRGQSLSGMIEGLLARELEPEQAIAPSESFTERWAGGFQVSARQDARARHLKSKYGLE